MSNGDHERERNPTSMHVAQDVVNNLRSMPVMLGLLVLNTIGIVSAVYFLTKMGDAQATRMDIILKACLPKSSQTNELTIFTSDKELPK
jgi:hypothetical protein